VFHYVLMTFEGSIRCIRNRYRFFNGWGFYMFCYAIIP